MMDNEIHSKKDLSINIGSALRELRKLRGFKQGDLGNRKIISEYESGRKSIRFDELLLILDKMNATIEELIYYIDDENFSVRERLSLEMATCLDRNNIKGLERIVKQATYYYNTTKSKFFYDHIAMAKANISLLSTTNDYMKARKELEPIKIYLLNLKIFFFNDLILLSQCLYIFDIDTSINLVEKAMETVKNHHEFYKDKKVGLSLVMNTAIYALDFDDYLHFSLDYSAYAKKLTISQNDMMGSLFAEIVSQIASFKLGDGTFSKEKLRNSLNICKILDWHSNYDTMKEFIQKHGIDI